MDFKNTRLQLLAVLSLFVAGVTTFFGNAQITHQCIFLNQNYAYHDTVMQGITYRLYTASGFELTKEPKAPELPVKLLNFSVPYNAENFSVTIISGNSNTTAPQSFKILPVPVVRAANDPLPMQFIPSSSIYGGNSFYPSSAVEIVNEGVYMGENRIVTVAVYPIQYNPSTSKLKFNQRVTFSIGYDLSNSPPSDVTVRCDTTLRRQSWNETKAMVVNPSQVEGFAPNSTAAQLIQNMNLPDSLMTALSDTTAMNGGELESTLDCQPHEYLIVTTRPLARSFRQLAALKRQKGYSVGIRCIEDIVADNLLQCGDSVPGAQHPIKDNAGKLRQFLRLSHQLNNTRFALLGSKTIPYRYCFPDSNKDLITSDLYYSDLSTNWNLDDDLYYGESYLYNFSDRRFDVNPELYIGRLEANSPEQVRNYTQKLLRYELNPGNGDPSYLRRLLINQGLKNDSDSWHDIVPLLMEACQPVCNEVTAIDNIATMSDSFPTGIDVIHEINDTQYGILALNGHGAPVCVNINEIKTSFIKTLDHLKTIPHTMGLDSLNNKWYPNIYYAQSCQTIPFDDPVFNMGQSFTLGKDYGGVAYIGNTWTSYSSAVSFLQHGLKLEELFFNSISRGHYKIGAAHANSRTMHYQAQRVYYDEAVNNLIGDPEFDVWTDAPTHFQSLSCIRNDNGVTLSNLSAGDTVAYCNGRHQGRKVASGNTLMLNIDPNSTIMAYRHNKLPYIAPLVLQNTTINKSQYVIASDVVAGSNVDNGRTAGDVTISSGTEFEIEHKGGVTLGPNFTVELGATLDITSSDY